MFDTINKLAGNGYKLQNSSKLIKETTCHVFQCHKDRSPGQFSLHCTFVHMELLHFMYQLHGIHVTFLKYMQNSKKYAQTQVCSGLVHKTFGVAGC
jgi:hypothetical protein